MYYFWGVGAVFMGSSLSVLWFLARMETVVQYFVVVWGFYSLNFMFKGTMESLLFLSVVSIISLFIFVYSFYYLSSKVSDTNYFMWLMVLFMLSMLMFVAASNLVSMLIGWDWLGISSYMLVMYYQNSFSYNSSLMTFFMNRVSDVGMVISVCLLWESGHSSCTEGYYSWLLSFFLLLAAFTKSAQLPFSVWLPAAMAAPTPVSALVHSSTLVTAGLFLLIQFYEVAISSVEVTLVVLVVSSISSAVSSGAAAVEADIKKTIAYSTMSQVSLMIFAVGLKIPEMALFHLLVHAFFKALLFMVAGVLIKRSNGSQDMRSFSSTGFNNYFMVMMYFLCLMSLMGLPFFSGFYSKESIVHLSASFPFVSSLCSLMLLINLPLTVVYSMRLAMLYTNSYQLKSPNFMAPQAPAYALVSCLFAMASLVFIFGALFFRLFFQEKMEFAKLNSPLFVVPLLLVVVSISISKHISGALGFVSSWVKELILSLLYTRFIFGVIVVFHSIMWAAKINCYEMTWGEQLGGAGLFKELGSKSIEAISVTYLQFNYILLGGVVVAFVLLAV